MAWWLVIGLGLVALLGALRVRRSTRATGLASQEPGVGQRHLLSAGQLAYFGFGGSTAYANAWVCVAIGCDRRWPPGTNAFAG